MQDIHDHEEVTPEPRELRAHDEVARPDAPQQRTQLAFVVRRRAADGLLDPAVDAQALATEVVNLETLVADRLTVTANPNVSVNHVFSSKIHIYQNKIVYLQLNMQNRQKESSDKDSSCQIEDIIITKSNNINMMKKNDDHSSEGSIAAKVLSHIKAMKEEKKKKKDI